MEILHNVTQIGDFYNGLKHPGRFEEMADAAGTHPTSYTKLEAGWLDIDAVPYHNGSKRTYTLHAVGLSQPPPGGRVAGIRVRAFGSDRYLIIEARLKGDRWDRGFSSPLGSLGIPSEGVIACEFAPESNPWPKEDPNGPWPPLELRTATALTVGQSFSYQAGRTSLHVKSATAGGFVIELDTDDVAVPFVLEMRAATAIAEIKAAGLLAHTTGASGSQAWVFKQSPRGGFRVTPGSTVTLQLKAGPIP